MVPPKAEQGTAMGWGYDREVKEHALFFNDGTHYMVVYKTGGGDYAITCRNEADPCGGDIEYAPNLRKAKAWAEDKIADGTWIEFVL